MGTKLKKDLLHQHYYRQKFLVCYSIYNTLVPWYTASLQFTSHHRIYFNQYILLYIDLYINFTLIVNDELNDFFNHLVSFNHIKNANN